MNVVSCGWCGADMPAERAEIYPNCIKCTTQTNKVAFMSYGCKTNPEMIVVDSSNTEQVRIATNAFRRKR